MQLRLHQPEVTQCYEMETHYCAFRLYNTTSTAVPVVLVCPVNASHILVIVLEYSWTGYLDNSLFTSPSGFLVSLWCVWGMQRLMNCTQKIHWFVVLPGHSKHSTTDSPGTRSPCWFTFLRKNKFLW